MKYFFHVKKEKRDLREKAVISCSLTKNKEITCKRECFCVLRNILNVYDKAGFPTIRHDRIITRIAQLIGDHRKLESRRNRTTEGEKLARVKFTLDCLDVLFDVMPLDIIYRIECDRLRGPTEKSEDISFVRDQKSERKFSIGTTVDYKYFERSNKSAQRKAPKSRAENFTLSFDSLPDTSGSENSDNFDESTDSLPELENNTFGNETEKTTSSESSLVENTIIISKAKRVSIRVQSEIIRHVIEG